MSARAEAQLAMLLEGAAAHGSEESDMETGDLVGIVVTCWGYLDPAAREAVLREHSEVLGWLSDEALKRHEAALLMADDT